jgi:hypothetical protein
MKMKVHATVSTILVAITIDACVKSTTAFVTSQTPSNHARNTGESTYRAHHASHVGLGLQFGTQGKELVIANEIGLMSFAFT